MGGSAPKAPDPEDTARAQAGMNRDTAMTQQLLNMVNQVTPDGSLTYSQTGNTRVKGADGKYFNVPQYTATQELSPQQQAIYDQLNGAKLNFAGIANDQTARVADILSTPLKLDNDAVEGRINELASKRLDPLWQQRQTDFDTKMAAQGIAPGSEAYDRAYQNFSQGRNDAYNSMLLNGRQQAINELLTERETPINEATALMSGSQVSQPNFVSTPQTSVAGVDYTGLVNQQYQAEQQAYQNQMGGLFGLLGSGVSAMATLSDRRAKEGIRRVGTLDNGLPVYSYRYKGDARTQIGLMADEVAQIHPEAVAMHPSGLAMVNYERATEAA